MASSIANRLTRSTASKTEPLPLTVSSHRPLLTPARNDSDAQIGKMMRSGALSAERDARYACTVISSMPEVAAALRLSRAKRLAKPAHERRIVRIISAAREESGLSARALSVKLGEAPSYIGRIERLQRKVGLAEFTKIAETLKRNPLELYGKTLFR